MARLIIDEMRISYGGWFDEEAFPDTQDSSPSRIIDRKQLNCVGRSILLCRALYQTGIKLSTASTRGHASVAGKFANGEEHIIEASGYVGDELLPVVQIDDPDSVLRKERG